MRGLRTSRRRWRRCSLPRGEGGAGLELMGVGSEGGLEGAGLPAEIAGESGQVAGIVFLAHDDLVAVESKEAGDAGGAEEVCDGYGDSDGESFLADDQIGADAMELGPGELIGAAELIDLSDG